MSGNKKLGAQICVLHRALSSYIETYISSITVMHRFPSLSVAFLAACLHLCIKRNLLLGRSVYGVSVRPLCDRRRTLVWTCGLVGFCRILLVGAMIGTSNKSHCSLSGRQHIGQRKRIVSVSISVSGSDEFRKDSYHFKTHPLQIGCLQSHFNCNGAIGSGEC